METNAAVAALAALAQGTRLEIFRLLVRAGDEGAAAGEIAAALGLPAATLSFHLSQLRHAGLVRYRREGRSLIYAAEYSAMNELIDYLTENCCEEGFCEIEMPLPAGLANRSRGSRREKARTRRR